MVGLHTVSFHLAQDKQIYQCKVSFKLCKHCSFINIINEFLESTLKHERKGGKGPNCGLVRNT